MIYVDQRPPEGDLLTLEAMSHFDATFSPVIVIPAVKDVTTGAFARAVWANVD